jgi:hypothetical protein
VAASAAIAAAVAVAAAMVAAVVAVETANRAGKQFLRPSVLDLNGPYTPPGGNTVNKEE